MARSPIEGRAIVRHGEPARRHGAGSGACLDESTRPADAAAASQEKDRGFTAGRLGLRSALGGTDMPIIVLAMLVLASAAVAPSAGDGQLVLDDSRIALLGLPDAAAGVEAANAALAGTGLAVELLRELPLAGGVLVSVPAGTGAEALVRQLAAAPDGPMAAPVLLDANG